ncbi:MAG: efflux RND transporter permease subunit, partial [Alphaproteobacteria bacterium]|nr:efflux RND transporter permease subunit [Alphaproteobacteria bacterium]
MMCSRLLKHRPHPNVFDRIVEGGLNGLKPVYLRTLRGVLKARWLVAVAAAGLAGASGYFLLTLPSELAPPEDRGMVIGILVMPEGSTVELTTIYAHQMQNMIVAMPEAMYAFAMIGQPVPSMASTYAGVVDWADRDRSVHEMIAELRGKMFEIRGGLAFPNIPPPMDQDTNARPLDFVVQTNAG